MKMVQCKETGKVYQSVREAGLKNEIMPNDISACLNGKRLNTKGLHWERIEVDDLIEFFDFQLENADIDEKERNTLKQVWQLVKIKNNFFESGNEYRNALTWQEM